MMFLLKNGDTYNRPVKQYYAESEEEAAQIKDAIVGSTLLLLTEDGLKTKMLHSSGKWIEI